MGYGSNRGRPSEIGRPGWFGLVGAAARLAGALLRGGGWPEKGNGGLPDSVWAPVWPWGMREACVIHLCAQRSGSGLGTACAAAGRVSAATPADVRAVRGSGPSAGESAAVRRAKGKPRRGPGVVVRS